MFGTDGVRGVANRDLHPLLAFRLGRAFAGSLPEESRRKPILVGRDTRASGTMLQAALVAGITSAGVDAYCLGVIPTPGVAWLTQREGAAGGVMISASHNPVEDNGLKFFSSDGYKLTDEEEDRLEATVRELEAGTDRLPAPTGIDVGRVSDHPELVETFVEHLLGTVDVDWSGRKVVLDCGHGAASTLAPEIFRRLGAEVVLLNASPNGNNINVESGSTHPEVAQQAVLAHGADVGFSFDGDADRVIAVDEAGRIVDGDRILVFCGRHLLAQGRLRGGRIAVTQYSNLGVAQALEETGGGVVVTQAGDRYVLEAMREHGLNLGGEQSGHVIFLDHSTTGDGILTALQVAQVMQEQGRPLSQLADELKPYPQVLESVRVRERAGWEERPRIREALQAAEAELAGVGRIFVRPSGTEPLIRVLVEGPDAEQLQSVAERVCAAIEQELGA